MPKPPPLIICPLSLSLLPTCFYGLFHSPHSLIFGYAWFTLFSWCFMGLPWWCVKILFHFLLWYKEFQSTLWPDFIFMWIYIMLLSFLGILPNAKQKREVTFKIFPWLSLLLLTPRLMAAKSNFNHHRNKLPHFRCSSHTHHYSLQWYGWSLVGCGEDLILPLSEHSSRAWPQCDYLGLRLGGLECAVMVSPSSCQPHADISWQGVGPPGSFKKCAPRVSQSFSFSIIRTICLYDYPGRQMHLKDLASQRYLMSHLVCVCEPVSEERFFTSNRI